MHIRPRPRRFLKQHAYLTLNWYWSVLISSMLYLFSRLDSVIFFVLLFPFPEPKVSSVYADGLFQYSIQKDWDSEWLRTSIFKYNVLQESLL